MLEIIYLLGTEVCWSWGEEYSKAMSPLESKYILDNWATGKVGPRLLLGQELQQNSLTLHLCFALVWLSWTPFLICSHLWLNRQDSVSNSPKWQIKRHRLGEMTLLMESATDRVPPKAWCPYHLTTMLVLQLRWDQNAQKGRQHPFWCLTPNASALYF